MKDNDVRHEIAKIAQELYAQGLMTSTAGNLSARDPVASDQIWITPSKEHKAELTPGMMVRINLDGEPIDDHYPASIERQLHSAAMRINPGVNAVVHTHPPHAIVLTLTELPFLPISVEASLIGEIPRLPFLSPGSEELGLAVAEALEKGPAVLMQNHGMVVAASSLREAADISLIVEETAKALVTCKILGIEPATLEEEQVAEFREKGELVA